MDKERKLIVVTAESVLPTGGTGPNSRQSVHIDLDKVLLVTDPRGGVYEVHLPGLVVRIAEKEYGQLQFVSMWLTSGAERA